MAITFMDSRWYISSGIINNYSRGLHMYVHVDPESIKVEIRCHKCDAVMHIFDQYESNEILTIEVGTCDECEEE